MKRKAISIQQPWAYAILHLGKDVENRTWLIPYGIAGTRLVIHAGKKIDQDGLRELRQLGFAIPEDLPTGCLVGEVDVVGHMLPTECEANIWASGPVCWKLANPAAYPEPIPCRGQLKIFEVEVPDA